MSPPPGRHRGSRPQVSNQIGEIGRTTGIKPPKKLQRDSNGFENPEEFFARAERSQPDDQDSSERSQDEDDDEDDEDGLGSIQQSNKKSNTSGGESKKFVIPQRRQERPDRFLVGEDRGRKTGIYKPQGPRGSDGFENIDDFFRSPSPTRSVASTAAESTVQRTAQISRTEHYEEDDEEEEEDTSMMIDGDTTSLSPTTYQRTHVAASASASKSHKPSSLRKSTVPSGSQSSSRKSLNNRKSNATSSPGTATDEEPSRGGGGGGTKSIRRRLSSLSGSGEEGEEMQDEPVIEELELGSDGEDDASGGEGNTTIGGVSTIQGQVESDEEEEEVSPRSNKSRKSIGGKGKGRAVESDDEQEEERTASSNSSSRKKGRKSKATSRGSPSVEGESTPQDKKGKGKGKEVVRSPSPRYQQQDQEFDLSAFGGDDQGGDYGGGFSDDDGAGMGEYGSSIGGDSPRQEQFADESGVVEDQEVEEEDQEEEEEEEQPVASTSKSKAKGKGKEKDKGKGKGKDKKGKEPAKEKSPRRKKRVSDESNSSMETVTAKRARRATPSQERVIEEIPRDRQRVVGSVDDHGVRRSGRQRIEPLEYWRNERIIYRKRQSGVGMTAIVRVPKIEPEPLTTVGRKRAPRSKSAKPSSRTRAKSVKEEPEVDEDEGIDDMTDPDGLVWSWEGNAETTRRICFTRKMMDPKATFNNQYLFQKIYQELDYLAGGILVIPVGGQKATKPAKDNSYIFFVTQGSVSVVCHRTRVSVGRDGSFFIPRGNSYSIEATSNKDVRLFFAQGRRVIELEDGSTRPDTMESSQQVLAYNAEGERLQSVVEEEEEEEEEEEQEESQGSGSEQQEEEEEED